jgi:hypothetical protein
MAKCISRFSNLIALLDSVAMIFGGFSQSCGMFHRYLQLATSTGFLEGCLYSTLRVSQLAQPINIATLIRLQQHFRCGISLIWYQSL